MNQKLKTLTFILAVLSILFFTEQSKASCHIDDWTALKAIYDSADGDDWDNRNGWSSYIDGQSSPPADCNLNSLYGVTVQNGRVTKISLNENRPAAQYANSVRNLPSGSFLRKLSHLKELRITNFNLSGGIPYFYSMPNLVLLDLQKNKLSGSVPWWKLYNLVNMEFMRLDNNLFSGSLPNIGNYLPNLERFFLAHNDFTGSIPSSYGNLSNMYQLTIQYNDLSGNFASSLNNLCGINWNDPWDYYFNRGNNFNQLWSSFCSGYRKASPNNLTGSGYLEQNSPNPAISFTTIEYFIPENSKTAELILRDVTGKVIETVVFEKTGTGTIQFATNNLPIGIYAYTLYSDGEMLATKRMIVGNTK